KRSPLILISRRRPSSTLFPYTTLFRSELLAELAPAFADLTSEKALDVLVGNGIVAAAILSYEQVTRHPDVRASGTFVEVPDAAGDRKSTRLNSSHVKNSYAVFCLKKKT